MSECPSWNSDALRTADEFSKVYVAVEGDDDVWLCDDEDVVSRRRRLLDRDDVGLVTRSENV